MAPARGATQNSFDICLGHVAEPIVVQTLASCLLTKGFCVIDLGLDKSFVKQVLDDANSVKTAGRFYTPPDLIAEGLLGREGSAKIADLAGADASAAERDRDGEAIKAVDNTLTAITQLINHCHTALGFFSSHRTPAVVHEAGIPRDVPDLTEKDVTMWLDKFLRHKIMAVAFFGPMEGALKLQVYDDEDADVHEVRTSPGTVVVLRPDLLSHHHIALGKAVALSCFSIQGTPFSKRHETGGWIMCPVARELDRWAMQRVRMLKEMEDDEFDEAEVPAEFRRAMDLCFFKEGVHTISGMALRFPASWETGAYFKAMTSGPDLAVQIPMSRWDHHNYYDPSMDGWQRGKTFTNHGAFIDGLELFDAKMFGISPAEAKGMDPHQRLVLEAGYEALYNMGMRKKSLMNSSASVYVGWNSLGDWDIVERVASGPAGPTSGSGCIVSNRLSFIFGLKGPSLTVTTDSASSLSAVYLLIESMQQKGNGARSDLGVGMGCSSMLSPVWWSQHCANGWMTFKGRCFAFDTGGDGYCRGEGIGAAACAPLLTEVDGKTVADDMPQEGILCGIAMNTNAASASLTAPDAMALQEVIANCCRAASLAPRDIDAVEAHSTGTKLSDAVEVHALGSQHRSQETIFALPVGSVKTSVGHAMEASGMTGFLKIVQAAQWTYIPALVHLREINEYLDSEKFDITFPTEGIEYPRRSSLTGIMSMGYGGTNVYAVCWGSLDDKKVGCRPSFPSNREMLCYWPGGGGALTRDELPTKGYYIAGSWNEWRNPQRMELEGNDTYGLTITLGENRWEMFQIWLDGDPMRVLHPGQPGMQKESPVLGPDPVGGAATSWAIIGCMPEMEMAFVEGPSVNRGLPLLGLEHMFDGSEARKTAIHPHTGKAGSQYRIRLRIAGRWRMVDWDKLDEDEKLQENAALPPAALGRYYVMGSWNCWCTQPMQPDEAEAGCFFAEIRLLSDGGEFYVVRNRDSFQTFFPSSTRAAKGQEPSGVEGPGLWDPGTSWMLDGRAGDVFRLEFRRSQVHEKTDASMIWRYLRNEPLTEIEIRQTLKPCYCVVGSWNGFRDVQPMIWDEFQGCYTYTLRITDVGMERFQILRDGNPSTAIYPDKDSIIAGDSTAKRSQKIRGPDDAGNDAFFIIGEKDGVKAWPGMKYQIQFYVDSKGSPELVEWNRV
eukprot:TRINITY_DN104075_c0_g1_i1.p1 TRINITY_DN104075_c0_g1~~TRINITY_DN104075_c0_g1_i1.p1  ORF type:complete len:1195 (+),score=182.04 TRINITY_DN104075_c0_g1_i1:72-3587(+)